MGCFGGGGLFVFFWGGLFLGVVFIILFLFGLGIAGKHTIKKKTVHKESEARISGRAAVIQHGCNTEFKEGRGESSRAPRGPSYNLNLYRPRPLNEVTALNAHALPGFFKKKKKKT